MADKSGRMTRTEFLRRMGLRTENGKKHAILKNKMTRAEFLKLSGLISAAAGISAAFRSGAAGAQAPPRSDPVQELMTLAAVVDTIAPTTRKTQVPVFGPDGLQVGSLPSAGSANTDTAGAVDFPGSYLFLRQLLPRFTHVPDFPAILSSSLDLLARTVTGIPDIFFKDLDYETRYGILYLMDKPGLMVQGGADPQIAAQLKQLLTPVVYLTFFIYYSELCNLKPSEVQGNGMPLFKRNLDRSWDLVPGSPWDQMGYSGPEYKVPSYASKYEGLRATIADGKVKIVSR